VQFAEVDSFRREAVNHNVVISFQPNSQAKNYQLSESLESHHNGRLRQIPLAFANFTGLNFTIVSLRSNNLEYEISSFPPCISPDPGFRDLPAKSKFPAVQSV
jgi:hypothetical protein